MYAETTRGQWTRWRVGLVVFAIVALVLSAISAIRQASVARATPTTWYVSNAAAGSANGTSWSNAWSFTGISWASVNAGDTILLDGGSSACTSNYDFTGTRPGVSCGLLYNGTLTLGKSGTSGSPITIKLATDSGHNGTAVFFGGRASPLPYCTQSSYTVSNSGTRYAKGIDASGAQYVTVDGNKRSGIMVYGYDEPNNSSMSTGIYTTSTTANDTFRNLEIFDNGKYTTFSGGYNSDYPGVWLTGHSLTFDRDLIHDNGQDEFQGDGTNGAVNNISITNSWMYEHRTNTNYPAFGFNNAPYTVHCTHADGLQVYAGGGQSGLAFSYDIVGPFLMQDIYPTDVGTYYNNVQIDHSLLLATGSNDMNVDAQSPSTNPSNWTMSNITSWQTATLLDSNGWTNYGFGSGSNFTWTNSIFANGYNASNASNASASGNIAYNLSASVPGSTVTNPLFSNVPTGNTISWATYASSDWTPGCTGCSTKGSPIHTFSDLTSRIDSLNSPTLQSITVTPANATVSINGTQQYTATGNYSDGSQQNLTSTATWSTGNTALATITSGGLLTGVAAGTTTVSAVQSGITGQTNVTVSSTNGLSFAANAYSSLTSPFTYTSGSPGYISQPSDTSAGGPTAGGQAQYQFSVATAGDYVLDVNLSASGLGSNSVYLNLDSAPSAEAQTFDTPVTSGFQIAEASQRGNGGVTYGTNQYVPKVWTLSAGTHTLYVSGREATTELAAFTFVRLAGAVNWTASQMTLASPFTLTSGSPSYISQSSDTSAGGPSAGGQATYTFTVPTTGTYILNVSINAASTGANSIYVNMDGQPTTESQTSDTQVISSGFQLSALAQRSTGGPTYDTDQFIPQAWSLSAGSHTVYIRGRECCTEMAAFYLVPLS